MAAAGATLCSARIDPLKEKKNLRECCKYLKVNRLDRTQFWRRVGNVLVCDWEALKQAKHRRNAGQRQKQGVSVGYCSCGTAYPPRDKRGGDRMARRQRQRANRGRFRDDCTVSRVLAQSLNPLQGGSDSRTSETTSKLQIFQQFSIAGDGHGSQIRSEKDQAMYVGMFNPTNSIDDGKKEGKDKKGQETAEGSKQQNKTPRGINDGLLLVVTARINGHPVRALIDSGATRCFVTPACVTAVGLKGQPQDTFLELGNGQKFLSRGFVPDVTVVTAGLTVKVGLTVTNLLHEVDLVLGVNWLQLVNPVVNWSSGKVDLPNAVHTALLQGDWLEDHVKAGIVTVLAGEQALQIMNETEVKRKISILKCPKFWRAAEGAANSWTNSFRGRVEWGFLYNTECTLCKNKNECNDFCKHKTPCKLYVIKNDEGDEVVKIKRLNVNAKLPVRGTEGAAGYDLSAAQAAVVPAHGKCLVKTGLAMAIPPRCYGRVAPRSGLALKKFIDVGAGAIDADYRGEIGVVLFNFGKEDFVVNMGDRIAQLIFEKIKTPTIKESDEIGETDRGAKGYGSTGDGITKLDQQAAQDPNSVNKNSRSEMMLTTMDKGATERTPCSQSRQIISARQIQKLAKGDHPVYLAIVRKTNEIPPMKKKNKRFSARAAQFAAVYGMSEGTKRSINKRVGPKKDIITVAEREQEVLASVPVCHRERLEHIIQEYHDVFPEQLPKGIPPARAVEHTIKIEPGSKPSYRPPYRLGPSE